MDLLLPGAVKLVNAACCPLAGGIDERRVHADHFVILAGDGRLQVLGSRADAAEARRWLAACTVSA